MRLLGLGRKDPYRLQPVTKAHLIRRDEALVQLVAEERDTGHLGAVTILVETTDPDHGMQILRRERS